MSAEISSFHVVDDKRTTFLKLDGKGQIMITTDSKVSSPVYHEHLVNSVLEFINKGQ